MIKRHSGSSYNPYVPRNMMPNNRTTFNGAASNQQKNLKKKGNTFGAHVGGFTGVSVGFCVGGPLGAIIGGILGAYLGRS